MTSAAFVSSDELRTRFSRAMSQLYKQEVPQYGTLLELVRDVNAASLAADRPLQEALSRHHELQRLDVERHGAIRLGTAQELATMRRIFRVMGMEAVGYYDLSVAGVPVHSTAFRPVTQEALQKNPFRVFTSLLRLELLEDPALREEARAILDRRNIFTPRALELLALFESAGGLNDAQADDFVAQVIETFRWHRRATVDATTYRRLHDAHRLVADVVCFKCPHINHLTPRTLDIDAVQAAMQQRGLHPKEVVEGPPRRRHAILLRQTSFKALEETVAFGADALPGTHTARFGEIEQRGMALTRRGRQLYDELLARAGRAGDGSYEQRLASAFENFPDDLGVLHDSALAFFSYAVADETAFDNAARQGRPWDLQGLLCAGIVEAVPITYEDFLPVSAAGIFQSNLGGAQTRGYTANAAKAAFEADMQGPVLDEMELYEGAQSASIQALRQRFELSA